jgi:hypothetical protein
MTSVAGRKRMVNFVRRSVMRVRCSTSRDSLRVRREKFWMGGEVSEVVVFEGIGVRREGEN